MNKVARLTEEFQKLAKDLGKPTAGERVLGVLAGPGLHGVAYAPQEQKGKEFFKGLASGAGHNILGAGLGALLGLTVGKSGIKKLFKGTLGKGTGSERLFNEIPHFAEMLGGVYGGVAGLYAGRLASGARAPSRLRKSLAKTEKLEKKASFMLPTSFLLGALAKTSAPNVLSGIKDYVRILTGKNIKKQERLVGSFAGNIHRDKILAKGLREMSKGERKAAEQFGYVPEMAIGFRVRANQVQKDIDRYRGLMETAQGRVFKEKQRRKFTAAATAATVTGLLGAVALLKASDSI